jgi:23S rRNA (cytidine1920-2'-O)/16S rRNA (cytidine1409-2'-O)-methyltransferase
VLKWLQVEAHLVALIKPQFEAGRDRVGRGGVVRDPQVHADVLRSIVQSAQELGYSLIDLIRSPIEGPAGNIEFLAWLRPGVHDPVQPVDELIRMVLP